MRRWILILLGVGLVVSGCGTDADTNGALTASGTIRADTVAISPENNAKVLSVSVDEGQIVTAGEVLFTQDDALLQAQAEQARAAVTAAEAAVAAAEAQLAGARVQLDLALQGARLQETQARATAWSADVLADIDLPPWYFQKAEDVAAALAEVEAARAALDKEQAALDRVLQSASSEDFVAAEKRLIGANAAFQAAQAVLERAERAEGNEDLEAVARDNLDAARTELDAAKLEYNRLLTATASRDVLETRARVAVAQARLDQAYVLAAQVQTGEASLQVEAARAGVAQAETAVSQAQAGLAQAQAAVAVVELQLGRLMVEAPLDGTVLSRAVEAGEFAAAGSIAMTIADLEQVRLTVYVPEDEYGLIALGQAVEVGVDTFPARAFKGEVVAIAEQAQFTPRNVSTQEGRKSTVFAVEILLDNPDGALKPGMPADVTF